MREEHVGRSWEGHPLEDACPCPKAACGLVIMDHADPKCPEHSIGAAKTFRQIHSVDECSAVHSQPKDEA